MGIDELNLLPDDKDSGKGDDDLADLYANYGDMEKNLNIKETEGVFDSIYDTLFKLGKRIGEVEKEWLQGIDWESIYDKARNFGKGLADFLNGYLSDAELFYEKGGFIADTINTIANALDGFFRQFNGWQFGVDIGSFINGITKNLDWETIKSTASEMAHDLAMIVNGAVLTTEWDMVGSTIANILNTGIDFVGIFGRELKWENLGDAIAETINGFAEDFDAENLAQAINYWSEGITSALIEALGKVKWSLIGRKFGEFLRKLDVGKITVALAELLVKAMEGIANLWASSFAQAPLETALLTAIAVIKPRTIGDALSIVFSKAFNFVDRKKITAAISGLVSKLPISLPQLTIGVGAGFTEFTVMKDVFGDLYNGTENVVTGITKIATTSVATGAIMTGIFGFPAGTIAVAIAGCVGAVKGFSDAVIEAGEIAEKSWIGDAIKNEGGVGISEYLDGASKNFEDAGKKYDDFIDKVGNTDLEGAREKIDGDIDGIVISLQRLTLSDNIDDLSEQMAIIVGMFATFKADIENVFNEEVDTILAAGTSGLVDDAAGMAALAQGVEYEFVRRIGDKEAELQRIMRDMQNGVIDYEEGMTKIMEIRREINDLRLSQMEEVENSLDSVNLEIDFSNLINPETQETALLEMEASFETYRNEFNDYIKLVQDGNDEILASLQHVGESAELLGDKGSAKRAAEYIAEQLERQESDIKEAYDKYAEDMRNIEAQAWANVGLIIQKGQEEGLDTWEISARVEDYIENVFKPLEENIQKQCDEVGITWNSSITNMADQMVDDLGKVVSSPTAVGENLPDLFGWWTSNQAGKITMARTMLSGFVADETEAAQSAREFAASYGLYRDQIVSYAEKTSKAFADDAGTALAGAFGKSTSILKAAIFPKEFLVEVEGLTGEIKNGLEGIADTASTSSDGVVRSMKRMNIGSDTVRDSMRTLIGEYEKVSGKTDAMKDSIEKAASSFETMKDKANSSKAFENAKKGADDVVVGFKNIKDKGIDAANALATNLSNMTDQIKTAYDGITADTDLFMGKFNGEIAKLFSVETWKGTISGVPNVFRTMWEDTIKVMKTMWTEMANWINQNAKIEIPKTKIGNTEIGGTDIRLKVPKYEKGGFPEDGLFMANHNELVGSFENGRTVVANNGQIVEGIKQGVYEAVVAALATSSKDGNVTVELHGDAAGIFTAVVKENNNAIMRTGSSPIRR